MEVLRFGYEPMMPSQSKIILNKATSDARVSGLGNAARIPENTKWRDFNFVRLLLALRSLDHCKYLPS
ncbi:unnamed protein product [Penicillium egyptiacum]|uniref:Uncharacterized protein n=1 Tax=Penicillium egyptiacum TaxID=1303716 RepID=A0A9W4P733_9EURO|nr:unnamed protein product [Penicillium egyptiacum]